MAANNRRFVLELTLQEITAVNVGMEVLRSHPNATRMSRAAAARVLRKVDRRLFGEPLVFSPTPPTRRLLPP